VCMCARTRSSLCFRLRWLPLAAVPAAAEVGGRVGSHSEAGHVGCVLLRDHGISAVRPPRRCLLGCNVLSRVRVLAAMLLTRVSCHPRAELLFRASLGRGQPTDTIIRALLGSTRWWALVRWLQWRSDQLQCKQAALGLQGVPCRAWRGVGARCASLRLLSRVVACKNTMCQFETPSCLAVQWRQRALHSLVAWRAAAKLQKTVRCCHRPKLPSSQPPSHGGDVQAHLKGVLLSSPAKSWETRARHQMCLPFGG
jgi:hypothetical protein